MCKSVRDEIDYLVDYLVWKQLRRSESFHTFWVYSFSCQCLGWTRKFSEVISRQVNAFIKYYLEKASFLKDNSRFKCFCY